MLLAVEDLRVTYRSDLGRHLAVDGLCLNVEPGEIIALVGESGCGKTSTALAIAGLLPAGTLCEGSIRFRGEPINGLPESHLCRIRGRQIGMVFQDSLAALDPVLRIGRQVNEALEAGFPKASAAVRRVRAHEALQAWGLSDPDYYLEAYPHQLNGGARQRIALAMAMACGPALLIADEPTSALDTLSRYDFAERLAMLTRETGLAVLLVTHDLDLAKGLGSRLVAMKEGRIVSALSPRADPPCVPSVV